MTSGNYVYHFFVFSQQTVPVYFVRVLTIDSYYFHVQQSMTTVLSVTFVPNSTT